MLADKFKEINDTYGHATGDAVLQKIADCLKHTFRHEDSICRIGGDESVVFMLRMEERRNQLIQCADEALYQMKAAGRNGCAFYEGAALCPAE